MKIIQSLQDDGISPRAQIRLLDNTFLRLVFSFSAVPLVGIPFAIWIYLLGENLWPISTWIALYLFCAVAIRVWHRSYKNEAREKDAEIILSRWLPHINKVAFVHGLGKVRTSS